MQNKFIVNHNDRELGPLNEAQIKKMLSSNQLFPTDYFFDEEKKDWILLSDRFDLLMDSPVEVTNVGIDLKSKPQPQSTQSNLASFPQNPVNTDFEPVVLVENEKPVSQAPPRTPVTPKASWQAAPATPVVVTKATVSSASKSSPGKVHFAAGVGTISLKQVKAGQISLKLKSASGLDLPTDLNLMIQAGPASQIKVNAPQECRAGEDVSVELQVFDAFKNIVADFKGSMEVILAGSTQDSRPVDFKDGVATVVFKPTRAEVNSVQIKTSDKTSFAMPASQPLIVLPNVPVKLTAELPQEVRAGDEIHVKITAIDAYGNIVTDFKGDLDLAVEIETVKKAG
jgi:hypothetical protein